MINYNENEDENENRSHRYNINRPCLDMDTYSKVKSVSV